MTSRLLLGALCAAFSALLPAVASAQAQQVKPPIALYWMSIETAGGLGMDLPPGMGAMMPAGMAGGKRMSLALGSSQAAAGDPKAAHAIPAALSMGQSLPLVTPRSERGPARERDDEPGMERPKGRLLLYWGCGEQVRAGQPAVLDFATMKPEDAARVLRSRAVASARGPAPGRNRSYGDWPNAEDSRAVPAGASLKGEHVVSGNYSPEIRFRIGERDDFMDAVAFSAVDKTAAGAYGVKWQAIPTATGYFASAVGQGGSDNELLMWSSSEVQMFGQNLMDYIAPAEVGRLIREKIVMTPQTTECTVPAGVFKSDAAMLNFIAYGDELNLVHPPRPQDPKQVWEQQWAVKVRLKSTGMTQLAEGGAGGRRSRSAVPQREAEPPKTDRAPTPADAVQEGVKSLRKLLPF
jgi:hypothetical protein